ncbi:hypothetical protein RB195_004591 [Necator americanus]|uniref:Uncharacterized protein n=1 Tax=Necator americanus TaxID=51031 RepID=A0ABR1BIS2_NECAM
MYRTILAGEYCTTPRGLKRLKENDNGVERCLLQKTTDGRTRLPNGDHGFGSDKLAYQKQGGETRSYLSLEKHGCEPPLLM